ncbi:MAG: helix-turn-helix transcriptional regulator [Solobacterium sp.]|nr:helix-turn-helix transcriptional regulator [Solobacterium sp.]
METNILFQICDSFENITDIPVVVFKEDTIIFISNRRSGYANLCKNLYDRMQKEEGNISVLSFSQELFAGCFYHREYTILAGPVMSMRINVDDLSLLLQENHMLVHDNRILHDLVRASVHSYQQFYDHLFFLFCAINHEEPKNSVYPEKQQESHAEGRMREEYEVQWAEYNDQFVSQMQRIIENGRLDELEAFMKTEQPAPYGTLSKDELRHQKNSCFVLLYIVRKAAEKGGMEPSFGLRLAEGYSQRIDAAVSANDLRYITQELRRDYCTRVAKLKINREYSPQIQKIIRYIQARPMKKISLDQIANDTGISKSYMCALFKQETGKNIGEYMQEEKIKTAKDLLQYSDYSVMDIAEYLSFSSQCYFQNVFKKVTGMTPKQYRMKVKYEN